MSVENATTTALIILPCVTGSISFLFSWLLIIRLIRHRSTLLKKVKERLILGLCFMDIIFSIGCIMSTFAGPTYLLEGPTKEMHAHFHLKGSRATCNLQGWLYNLGVGGPMYNAALCCYYYLFICRRMRDETIKKWIEPLMHAIIWTWGLLNGSIAVGLDFIWFGGYFGCIVVNPRPWERCTLNPNLPDCQGTYESDVAISLLTLAPNVVAVVLIIVFISLVYCKVRKTEVRGRRWHLNAVMGRMRESVEMDSSSPVQRTATTSGADCSSQFRFSGDAEMPNDNVNRSDGIGINSESFPAQQQRQTTRRASKESNTGSLLSNAVSETGMQYVLAFFATYIPAMIQIFVTNDTAKFNVPLASFDCDIDSSVARILELGYLYPWSPQGFERDEQRPPDRQGS